MERRSYSRVEVRRLSRTIAAGAGVLGILTGAALTWGATMEDQHLARYMRDTITYETALVGKQCGDLGQEIRAFGPQADIASMGYFCKDVTLYPAVAKNSDVSVIN